MPQKQAPFAWCILGWRYRYLNELYKCEVVSQANIMVLRLYTPIGLTYIGIIMSIKWPKRFYFALICPFFAYYSLGLLSKTHGDPSGSKVLQVWLEDSISSYQMENRIMNKAIFYLSIQIPILNCISIILATHSGSQAL